MYIKEFIEYSKEFDFIEGFEDLGHYERTNKSANCVLVFMAQGIYSPWKFPVAYFLAHSGVNKTILKNLIIDVLQKLFEVGLCPKIIVCDQGTNNQSALKSLNVSEDSPFFFINDNKIFSLFDVPHLIKSVRNNLINACFIKDDKIISFNDIKKTYELDKENFKSRSLVKITDAHIYSSSFQKMRVKLAAQLLSNSMTAAIRTCIETGQLQSNTSSNTADFIDFINNLFDRLNSRSLYSNNAYLCALTDVGTVKNFLIGASQYFTNLQKLKRGKLTQSPCFKGFTRTINGILQFFESDKSNDIVFLMTNRLNHDKLENLFSIFRQNGGYNKNPTARTIRTSIRSNCIFSLYTSKGTNCEVTHEDDNPVIINTIRPLNKINFNGSTSSDSESNSNLSLCFLSSDEDSVNIDNNTDVTLEDCSITYFAGYLGYKYFLSSRIQSASSDVFDYNDMDIDDTVNNSRKPGRNLSSTNEPSASKIAKTTHKSIFSTTNRYSCLATKDNLETAHPPQIPSNEASDDTNEPVKPPPSPPPITVHAVLDFVALCSDFIKLLGADNFLFKSSSNDLKILTKNSDSYRAVIKYLNEKKAEYHTYQQRENKVFRVVRTIHPTTSLNEIGIAIQEIGFTVR
ncbi:hypothetical protein QTP88_003486 [Uroleucon formosanum]